MVQFTTQHRGVDDDSGEMEHVIKIYDRSNKHFYKLSSQGPGGGATTANTASDKQAQQQNQVVSSTGSAAIIDEVDGEDSSAKHSVILSAR